MNTNKTIAIHFVGLQPKEQTLFDRVINFNKTHGSQTETCDHQASANLLIVAESAFAQLGNIEDYQTVLVITKDTSLGDIQVASPLLITRVMKALESAIKLTNDKPDIPERIGIDDDIATDDDITTDKEKKVVAEEAINLSSPSEVAMQPIQTATQTVTQTALQTTAVSDQTKAAQQDYLALVIDDSAAIRKHLELELRDSGIASDFAESGEQALEKVKEKAFDLIFLDIMMPGIDGYETCKLIREIHEYKKTPIIMLSGKTSPLDEVQGIIAGATTYLTKPVKSAKLQEVLTRVITWIDNFNATKQKKKTAVV